MFGQKKGRIHDEIWDITSELEYCADALRPIITAIEMVRDNRYKDPQRDRKALDSAYGQGNELMKRLKKSEERANRLLQLNDKLHEVIDKVLKST